MKLCISALVCVGLVACGPEPSPQTAQDSRPARTVFPMPYDDTPPPPDEPHLTPASGTGAPRAVAPPSPEQAKPPDTSSGIDQGETPNDLQITHEIRKSIVANPTLSFTAKNVTIITRRNKVMLRGQVNSRRERASIEKAARKIGAVKWVDNQLVVPGE